MGCVCVSRGVLLSCLPACLRHCVCVSSVGTWAVNHPAFYPHSHSRVLTLSFTHTLSHSLSLFYTLLHIITHRPVIPLKTTRRSLTTQEMRNSLGAMGIDTTAAEARLRERSQSRGRKRSRWVLGVVCVCWCVAWCLFVVGVWWGAIACTVAHTHSYAEAHTQRASRPLLIHPYSLTHLFCCHHHHQQQQ